MVLFPPELLRNAPRLNGEKERRGGEGEGKGAEKENFEEGFSFFGLFH